MCADKHGTPKSDHPGGKATNCPPMRPPRLRKLIIVAYIVASMPLGQRRAARMKIGIEQIQPIKPWIDASPSANISSGIPQARFHLRIMKIWVQPRTTDTTVPQMKIGKKDTLRKVASIYSLKY